MTDSSPALVGRPTITESQNADAAGAVGPVRRVGIRFGDYGKLTTPAEPRHATNRGRSKYEAIRRIVEMLTAALLLVLTTPAVMLGVLLIKLTSRGPAFYTQMRVGRYGKPFPIIKLRTMQHNCEAGSGAVWATASDPRVTRVGRLLRTTHVDELPQLWNVLFGHMSLIGPRPERPEFIPVLEQAITGYRDRLQVRPGVTGLAQVQLPADTDIASVQRKLAYDLYYIDRMGPSLDLRVLFATLAKVTGVPFPVTRCIFRLPRRDDVLSSSPKPNAANLRG